jgi:hypothetical protein
MIAGKPHPDGCLRVHQSSCYSHACAGTEYRVDLQDRVCKLVSSTEGFIHALKMADIVYYSSIEDSADMEPFVPRTRIIYVNPRLNNGNSAESVSLFKMLEKLPPAARQHMHISLPTQKYNVLASIARHLAPATIYLPTSTGPATQERLRREFSNVQFVPKHAFRPSDCVAGPP